jgi:hypothetical protein
MMMAIRDPEKDLETLVDVSPDPELSLKMESERKCIRDVEESLTAEVQEGEWWNETQYRRDQLRQVGAR